MAPTPGPSRLAGKVRSHTTQHTLRAGAKQKSALKQQKQQSAVKKDDAAPPPTSSSSKGKAKEVASTPSASTSTAAPRKQVFKQVLASPLTVNWPTLSAVDAQPILYTLLDVLKQMQQQQSTATSSLRSEKTLRSRSSRQERKKARIIRAIEKGKLAILDDTEASGSASAGAMDVDMAGPSIPSGSSLTIGINSVTTRLELMIQHETVRRRGQKTGASSQDIAATQEQGLDLVFVCRSDVDPPKMIAHFPMLTCAVNAIVNPQDEGSDTRRPLLLIPLPAGAEQLLAKALNVRRCAILGLSTASLPQMDSLSALFNRIKEVNLEPLRAPWLESAASAALSTREYLLPPSAALVHKTLVNNVATSAPQNINAVKLAKKHTREEKKAWRKNGRREIGEEKRRKELRMKREVRRAKGGRDRPVRQPSSGKGMPA